ncbi:hypothetical protein Ancab_023775 [Ancistrocladus abbreviatus]
MAVEAGIFEILVPSRYISFTLPNLLLPNFIDFLDTDHVRIAVLDSPTPPAANNPPLVAAMLVPKRRENDWIFTTEAGHFQLLLSASGVSRLILIGNDPRNCDNYVQQMYNRSLDSNSGLMEKLERSLHPLLIGFWPKREHAESGFFEIPFLRYEDNVISGVILEKCVGLFVGEMLIEDVEIEGPKREFRRRLRFKRMPNLVQTEIRIVPKAYGGRGLGCLQIGELEFEPDLGVLVHPYLAPMVAGLSLVGGHLNEKFHSGIRPRALCIGVGGGALPAFLGTQLDLEVVGVEIDKVVLSVARRFFGLQDGAVFQICLGDGIEILKKLACHRSVNNTASLIDHDGRSNYLDLFSSEFDAILVDLDSSDCGTGISAPPLEFMQKNVLLAAKSSLSQLGVLVVNVMPPNKSFYKTLGHEFRQVFPELYEIDTGNGENYVVVAARSPLGPTPMDLDNPFATKLKLVISGALMDSVRKI